MERAAISYIEKNGASNIPRAKIHSNVQRSNYGTRRSSFLGCSIMPARAHHAEAF